MSSVRDLILSQCGKQEIVPTSVDGLFAVTFQADCFSEYKRRQAKAWDAKKPDTCKRLLAEADAYLLTIGLGDEKGNAIFSENDIPKLIKLSNPTFQSMLSSVTQVNGLSELTIEDAEKKSDATSGDSSPTDSPSS